MLFHFWSETDAVQCAYCELLYSAVHFGVQHKFRIYSIPYFDYTCFHFCPWSWLNVIYYKYILVIIDNTWILFANISITLSPAFAITFYYLQLWMKPQTTPICSQRLFMSAWWAVAQGLSPLSGEHVWTFPVLNPAASWLTSWKYRFIIVR